MWQHRNKAVTQHFRNWYIDLEELLVARGRPAKGKNSHTPQLENRTMWVDVQWVYQTLRSPEEEVCVARMSRWGVWRMMYFFCGLQNQGFVVGCGSDCLTDMWGNVNLSLHNLRELVKWGGERGWAHLFLPEVLDCKRSGVCAVKWNGDGGG